MAYRPPWSMRMNSEAPSSTSSSTRGMRCRKAVSLPSKSWRSNSTRRTARLVPALHRDHKSPSGQVQVSAFPGAHPPHARPRHICQDMMISDVGLPDMNGRQLVDVAREYHPTVPILFVTGAENAAVRAGLLGTSMAMIRKPPRRIAVLRPTREGTSRWLKQASLATIPVRCGNMEPSLLLGIALSKAGGTAWSKSSTLRVDR